MLGFAVPPEDHWSVRIKRTSGTRPYFAAGMDIWIPHWLGSLQGTI